MMNFDEKEKVSEPVIHQLVNCFNFSSDLNRNCQNLSNELRKVHTMLSEHIAKEEDQKEKLLSQYRRILATICQIKEYLGSLPVSHENKDEADTLKALTITVDNCLKEQNVEIMEGITGQPMRPGYHTTEGGDAIAHNSAPGTIVSILDQGYIQLEGERVIRIIRPAVVTVSTGPGNQNNVEEDRK